MYYIKKFDTFWAIYNVGNTASRILTVKEQEYAIQEFPELACRQVRVLYFEFVNCITHIP